MLTNVAVGFLSLFHHEKIDCELEDVFFQVVIMYLAVEIA